MYQALESIAIGPDFVNSRIKISKKYLKVIILFYRKLSTSLSKGFLNSIFEPRLAIHRVA